MVFPRLFSPLAIGPITLPNRIVLSAMTTGFGYEEGEPTPELIDYFAARTRSVGMATVAFGAVALEGRVERQIPWMWKPGIEAALAPLADAIHGRAALACLQLGHGGRQVSPKVIGRPPVAPSPIPPGVHVDVPPHPLTIAEIDEIIQQFGQAGKAAAAAGFDAVEVHGAHGYLIQQFLSPRSNVRDDEWGKDRTKFGREVIGAIRAAAPSLAVIVRINGSDLVPDGLVVDDALAAARAFTGAGADGLLVSAGVYGSVPYTIPLLDDPDGCFLDLASAVRAAVPVPVIGVGKVTLPSLAEAALERGDCDAVAIGRGLLADPEWAVKAAAGDELSIRPCIATVQGCAGMLQHGDPIGCTVNPEVGREGRRPIGARTPTPVLVVGGGPAGMEAARRAAELGHQVVLVEKEKGLGGQLRWAAATPPMAHFQRLLDWYERQLERFEVEVRLGSDLDRIPDGFGATVLAIGAAVAIPALEGYDLLPTWLGNEFVAGGESTTGTTGVPKSVVVIGHGQRTLATALWAARAGSEVTLLGAGRFGHDTSGLTRRALTDRCHRAGIRMVTGALTRIEAGAVITETGALIESEGLVLVEPLTSTPAQGLTGDRVGDATHPDSIAKAISDARHIAEIIGSQVRVD